MAGGEGMKGVGWACIPLDHPPFGLHVAGALELRERGECCVKRTVLGMRSASEAAVQTMRVGFVCRREAWL